MQTGHLTTVDAVPESPPKRNLNLAITFCRGQSEYQGYRTVLRSIDVSRPSVDRGTALA